MQLNRLGLFIQVLKFLRSVFKYHPPQTKILGTRLTAINLNMSLIIKRERKMLSHAEIATFRRRLNMKFVHLGVLS